MGDTQNTPGPWYAEGPDEFGDYNIVGPDRGLAVAAAVTNMRPAKTVSANARLIATAPELHDALETAFAYIGQPVNGGDVGGDDEDAITICTKMRVGDWRKIRDVLARAAAKETE